MRLSLFAFPLVLLAMSGCAAPNEALVASSSPPPAGRIFATATRAEITPGALARALGDADVAILGEIHDNPDHHAAQAWLVGEIRPAALAFEMIPATMEATLADLRRADATRDGIAAALDWRARGWPDFALYAPIMEAVPDAAITGGEVARDDLRTAMRDGAAMAGASLGEGSARFGLGIAPTASERATMAAEQMAAHCDALPRNVAVRMIEAQRLRDAALADAVLRALGSGRPVALITGNGHARVDRGAPLYLRRAAPGLDVASLGLVEAAEEADGWHAAAFAGGGPPLDDYVWVTAPRPREDPCAAFLRARGKGG
jgi:uncharacterized iron-regulated protein